MAKIDQSLHELKNHLKEQILFLKASASSFDEGFDGEAKRLAVSVRVLLHDTNNSISLLNQLGKKQIQFYDTCHNYNPRDKTTFHGLVIIHISPQGPIFVPRSVTPPRSGIEYHFVSFEEWWDRIIIVDDKKNMFSRKNIVLALANQEGGAHVDPELDADYVRLSKFNSLGWKSVVRKGDVIRETDIGNPVFPSMRQIAFEVIRTLKDEFPDIFPE